MVDGEKLEAPKTGGQNPITTSHLVKAGGERVEVKFQFKVVENKESD